MNNQVALVSVLSANGSEAQDVAVFFNGTFLMSADGDCGRFDAVEEMALNLATATGVDVVFPHSVQEGKWEWFDIGNELEASGKLSGGLKEYIIEHTCVDPDGDTYNDTAAFKAECFAHALDQLIDEYKSQESSLLSVEIPENEEITVLYKTSESDYHLLPQTGSSCWITVGNASVYVKQEAEGVVVDIFPLNGQANESIASTYALFSDCLGETN